MGHRDLGQDLTLLTGWGRTAPTRARVRHVDSPEAVTDALLETGDRGVIARGLGRSYGDAAQNAGGDVLDMTPLAAIGDVDFERGRVRVDAGVSLDRLMREAVPAGWFVPVTPGTRYVTVGGAIAADIHGKNHHHDGSFCRHVSAFDLLTPSGERLTLTGSDDAFWATAGGMGLTGIVTSATIQMVPIETSRVRVDTDRAADIDDLMARMEAADTKYRYSVAWVDLLARGAHLGRAVLTCGDFATLAELSGSAAHDPRRFEPRSLLPTPRWVPSGLVRRASVRAFNEAWFRKAPKHEEGAIQSIAAFFHPLDGVRDWNRVYGKEGFLQWQIVVPFGQEAAFRAIVERLSDAQCPSFVTVLKRFGAGHGWLSFPLPGWTLAVDVPTGTPGLRVLLDELDQRVLEAGGRVYLAKDSRLKPGMLAGMYPELERWREVRERLDPHRTLQSDLARRLSL